MAVIGQQRCIDIGNPMTLIDTSPRIIVDAKVADGWQLERITGPSRLYGANGLRIGPDGRIYVAQVAGSAVSAVDPDSGSIEIISPMDGNIVAPDDLVFDDEGNLYSTEITLGRVSVRAPNGSYRVLTDNMPCANPITLHQGKLFAGECRPDGRIMELDRNTGAIRVILDGVPMPNAFEVGPDGLLYFPVMGANEIWRVNPAGGAPEVVATELGVPDSVKFDSAGFIISTQVASGQVLRINPANGQKTILAQLTPGLDNCALHNGRIFVSNISGQLTEISPDGSLRDIATNGLQWPMGLAFNAQEELYIADGAFAYTLKPNETRSLAGMLFTPGYPGFNRGVCADSTGGWLITTANGDVARYSPAAGSSELLASGFDRLMDIGLSRHGAIVFTEYGTGEVYINEKSTTERLASGLQKPVGVTFSDNDECYVSDAGAGSVLKIRQGHTEVVIDGLKQPEGVSCHGDCLYVADVGTRELIEINLSSGRQTVIAQRLPIGGPPGTDRRQLGAVGNLSGPMHAFTGLAVAASGTLYLAGDAEGSVIAISRN